MDGVQMDKISSDEDDDAEKDHLNKTTGGLLVARQFEQNVVNVIERANLLLNPYNKFNLMLFIIPFANALGSQTERVRHNKFAGERPFLVCDLNSSNIECLHIMCLKWTLIPSNLPENHDYYSRRMCYSFDGFLCSFINHFLISFHKHPLTVELRIQHKFVRENSPEMVEGDPAMSSVLYYFKMLFRRS
uniref:Uncharacterized protein n=1 Tax=Ditylenchus dipsaci TaxID=166011 RepID=A0A915DZH8_9BILA